MHIMYEQPHEIKKCIWVRKWEVDGLGWNDVSEVEALIKIQETIWSNGLENK